MVTKYEKYALLWWAEIFYFSYGIHNGMCFIETSEFGIDFVW